MGKHEEWPHLNRLILNGLLSNESASIIRVLDGERWGEAEKRTAELIACIQPNQPSEDRRGAVADYVQRLIMKCFPCQVVTFGSVPLKTYLPDGDIDMTAFSENQNLKDTWAVQVRNKLESEEKNTNAEFHVKEVQYIQAEVKIIKCLVENIVVDISFNQLGGLCTLCFLEEVDNLINQDHLFKRSIILIKAWCYYESRILGAHHSLISTYALETLVLYIFHIYNNSFTGPLEVLYRFLEFFRNFDWENFCVSLWGPVPVGSLPDVNAEPPRRDGGELLLSQVFLKACNSVYDVFPGGLENQGPPFICKHLNVIDPLRVNNNLGRSVNKGNFYRIRSAFAFGAKRLARVFDCPKENIAFELNHFFMNTWERYGSGARPDAPMSDLECSIPLSPDHGSANHLNPSTNKESKDKASIEVEPAQSIRPLSSQRASYPLENTSTRKGQLSSSIMSDLPEKVNQKLSLQSNGGQKNLKYDQIANQLQGKHLFARTRSSPELSYAYHDATTQSNRIEPAEIRKAQASSVKMDSNSMLDVPINTTSASNTPVDSSRIVPVGEDQVSVFGAQGMQQEEQDLINMMASSSLHNFGHISMSLNLASTHLPLPMGYGQRNMSEMFPANAPLIDPHWGRNFQFYQGLMSSPLSQYFPGVVLPTNLEDVVEHGDENISSVDMRRGADAEYWHEQDVASTSVNSNLVSSSRIGSSECSKAMRDDFVESFQLQDDRVIDTYSDERISASKYSSASQAGSGRSKTSSESSWDGSSKKVPKVAREKRGKKAIASTAAPSKIQIKGKNIHEYALSDVDDEIKDCSTLPTARNETNKSKTTSVTDSVIPIAPMVLGPGSRQIGAHNPGTDCSTIYPAGPPVPFFTMLPVYNYPNKADSSDPSSSPLGGVDGPDKGDSSKNFELTERHDAPDILKAHNHTRISTKRDILNSDFASHWQNLQFGRLCQAPQYPTPDVCPSPVGVPSVYLQGQVLWDGSGRTLSANADVLSQLISYGHHLVPVIPFQSDSSRPTTVFQQYAGELPRYRSGTGTYLPNPKLPVRDRHSSGGRRNGYNYDRSDNADREGNWNAAKSRAAGRNYNRRQSEKSRIDRFSANENRSDKPWAGHRHQPLPYQAQNGPRTGSSYANMVYGMYPLAGMNPGGVSPNGQAMQSFVMLYPYDHSSGYASPGEQPEFASLGHVGSSDASKPADQPSSPHFHRRI